MDWSLPYQTGFNLGRIMDLKSLTMRETLTCLEEPPLDPVVHISDSRYAVVSNLKDVCNILNIPLDYALKVEVKEIQNDLVSACLDALRRKNSFSIIFRVSYVQQKQYFPNGALLKLPVDSNYCELDSSGESFTSESIGKSIKDLGTHWISALDIGNELCVLMTIITKDDSRCQKYYDKMAQGLKNKTGLIDDKKFKSLFKVANKVDEKVKTNLLQLTIKYFSFDDFPTYPASMLGMLRSLEKFTDQCTGWSQRRNESFKVDTTHRIKFHIGDYDDINLASHEVSTYTFGGLKGRLDSFFKGNKAKTSITTLLSADAFPNDENLTGDSLYDRAENSIEVLELNDTFYALRATFTLMNGESDTVKSANDSFTALNIYPENTFFKYDKVFNLLQSSDEIMHTLQQIKLSLKSEHQREEGEIILKAVESLRDALLCVVRELNYITMPSDEKINVLFDNKELENAKIFIENITTKLPPGKNLNLLLIGKTGHGKSATGNSILGQALFKCSDGATSETTEVSAGYSELDGRTLKVVDTPGLWDTRMIKNVQLIEKAIQSFSNAIAQCSEGFHALLVIFKFGTRITMEEQQSIKLLKSLLGEDIIKNYCVCLFTHGDNFEGSQSFMDWCRNQKGFLKGIMEECNYRCLLFNNKIDDFHQHKRQIIELVTLIDFIKNGKQPYTNHLFTLASNERIRLIEEAGCPELKEEIMQDIQIVFSRLITLTSEDGHHLNDLSDLKKKVEDLKDKTKGNSKLLSLLKIVETLSMDVDRAIQNKEEKLTNLSTNLVEDSPDFLTNLAEITICAQGLKEKNLEVNKQVSHKVEEQIKKDGISCFPGNSTVCLESGEFTNISTLKLGDKVLTRNSKGQLVFEAIYMFGHSDSETSTEFVVIKTASKQISLTAGHYIYCERNGQEFCLAAERVIIGDNVYVVVDGNIVNSPVITISLERKKGLYAPFTNTGNIVIDGILASCYINILHPKVCHRLLWPVRTIYRFYPNFLNYINGSSFVDPVPKWILFIVKLIVFCRCTVTWISIE